ncbi:uncharacterized protein DUF948 [Sediminihabitans luteus]|uniref:Uncharacterized protein DUF948 n=1 Tax=Sediminihabitans luteus TaxID=1138585 RepID=A0A2M9CQQ6_9CELL|nr:DUF948 domain-containing protein [Sediminihabitans luteus]PJJ74178.1 uncharacterized protein DUF948 [Sediminihabitans luteus]GII99031.1 hypothetical protein Slu03_14090 [Sediminihabitans luteus]
MAQDGSTWGMGDLAALLGAIAGLVAAVAFLVLVIWLAFPLVKLGRTFDEASASLKEATEHTLPILDEAAQTLASTNAQLENIDTITTSAAQVGANVSALSSLWAATLGRPLIKVSAFSYGVRQAYARATGRTSAEDAR